MPPTTATPIRSATPDEAWRALTADPSILLLDVRTQAEWSFVGAPDLTQAAGRMAFVEWAQFPTMAPNPDFARQAAAAAAETGATTIYCICRSGARSLAAAQAIMASGGGVTAVNVAEGFEGDLDADGRRGALNGWKARGLPWRQS